MAPNYDGFTSTPSYFKWEDPHDGKRYRYAVTHATLVVGTLYALLPDKTNHAVTAAIADNALTFRVGVALDTTPTGEVARLQTGGVYDSMTTPSISVTTGHTLEIAAGAVADGAALPIQDAQQFAVYTGDTSSNADTHTVYLLDREITGST